MERFFVRDHTVNEQRHQRLVHRLHALMRNGALDRVVNLVRLAFFDDLFDLRRDLHDLERGDSTRPVGSLYELNAHDALQEL